MKDKDMKKWVVEKGGCNPEPPETPQERPHESTSGEQMVYPEFSRVYEDNEPYALASDVINSTIKLTKAQWDKVVEADETPVNIEAIKQFLKETQPEDNEPYNDYAYAKVGENKCEHFGCDDSGNEGYCLISGHTDMSKNAYCDENHSCYHKQLQIVKGKNELKDKMTELLVHLISLDPELSCSLKDKMMELLIDEPDPRERYEICYRYFKQQALEELEKKK